MALADSIVAYYKFDESSGNAIDSVSGGSTNTLVNNGTTPYAAALINNGANPARASNQYYTLADGSQTGYDFANALTFAGWVRFSSLGGGINAFFSKYAEGGNNRSFIFFWGNDEDTLQLYTSDNGSSAGVVSVAWTPSTNTWYHVAVTKSTGTSTKFYVNGSQQGTTQTGAVSNIYNGSAAVGFGEYGGGYITGLLDEWGVWARELSGSEIAELYNSGVGLSYPFASAYDETYTETMTLVDTINKNISRTLVDVMTLVDTFISLKILAAVLTETMILVDTITRSISRTLTDVMTLVDTIPRAIARTLTDVMILVDTITTAQTIGRVFTETMTLVDSFLVNGSNVIWTKVVKSADAVWTKIIRS